ncbi:MAG: hypothetical protein ACYCSI_03395 [Solirubrobacteraceae bacterium]
MGERDPYVYRFAVGGISVALVAFLIAGGVVGASGHAKEMVSEYWAIGAALVGALVGILAPSPKEKQMEQRAYFEHDNNPKTGPTSRRVFFAAFYQPVVLVIALAVSLWLASEVDSASAAVLRTLAAGSAGGLLGLLVPNPAQH